MVDQSNYDLIVAHPIIWCGIYPLIKVVDPSDYVLIVAHPNIWCGIFSGKSGRPIRLFPNCVISQYLMWHLSSDKSGRPIRLHPNCVLFQYLMWHLSSDKVVDPSDYILIVSCPSTRFDVKFACWTLSVFDTALCASQSVTNIRACLLKLYSHKLSARSAVRSSFIVSLVSTTFPLKDQIYHQ